MAIGLNAQIKKIHCIGVGGAGMSAIAEVLQARHYQVSGSDCAQSASTVRLEKKGITIAYTHDSDVILQADLVVYSSAIATDNPELVLAKTAAIPAISRGQMLAELMNPQYGIAVGGTHGKTSTVGLIARLFLSAGLDPTLIMGGYLNAIQSHAHPGKSDYFITEADESDASLLFLKPKIAVLTNIDADHLATYGGDFNQLVKTYKTFLQSVNASAELSYPAGWMVLCYDDPLLRQIKPSLPASVLTYGFHPDAMIRGEALHQMGQYLQLQVVRDHCEKSTLSLQVPLSGQHNALNVLAAVAVATLLDIPDAVIQNSLQHYTGVARRFQLLGEVQLPQAGAVQVIDDYGHHPQEVDATVKAIRESWPGRRLVMVFQPHRYTRTQDLFKSFVDVLSQACDELIMLPIYAANETPIPNVNSHLLLEAIKRKKRMKATCIEPKHLMDYLRQQLQPNDIVLFQGAGNVSQMAHEFVSTMQSVQG